MASKHYDFLIIGGGLAAATAIRELVRLQPSASIGLLAAENELPYNRPPLSKKFLLGDISRESLLLARQEFYDSHGVDLHLGLPAESVNPGEHLVTASGGGQFGYGKLLIASGCALRRLTIPGADMPGLYYLRRVNDSEALHRAAANARRAVLIGGGFINLEVASVLSEVCDGVTIIHRADRLCEKFENEDISTFIEELYQDMGVHTVYEDEAAELLGDGKVSGVLTARGRTLPCDLAVAGIGVYPNTTYLDGSGIETGNGVVVNEYLETSAPDVFAAGDVSNFYDPVFGRRRRTEHLSNALKQGMTAAHNLNGAHEPYRHVSYFNTTVFNVTYEFLGDMAGYDEVIPRGSFDKKSVAFLYLKEGVLQAAFLMNRPMPERRALESLILNRMQLDSVRSRLGDESFLPETLVA